VSSFLRLPPVRAVVYRLIDAGIFRHALEERLKRDFIVLDAASAEDAHGATATAAVVTTIPSADQAGHRAAGGSTL